MLKKDFSEKVKKYLFEIYSNDLSKKQINNLYLDIKSIFTEVIKDKKKELWSEKDVLLITYADSIIKKKSKKLNYIIKFFNKIL